MKRMLALMALTMLTACDYAEKRDLKDEQDSSSYRSAMADYRAGRIDAAVKGFKKVIRENPANASARFQLACLLQDAKKDYLPAYCGYLEYLAQHPESDKAEIARERLAICEKELAKVLASKHGLNRVEAYTQEIESLKADLKAAEQRARTLEQDLADSRRRTVTLDTENERLKKIIKTDGQTDVAPPRVVKEAKDLLEEEAEDVVPRHQNEMVGLRSEEQDEISAGSSLLPARTTEDLAKRVAQEQVESDQRAAAEALQKAQEHPETYVVQEGDTLYRIAARFYGRISAWKAIRDANKAVISTDGRVRAGQTIKLP